MEESRGRDRYRRLRKLGEGGAGCVWLVEDLRSARQSIALKELPESSRGMEEELRREFAILSSLRHPNLVEVYEFDVSPETGLARFTLEFIEGPNIVTLARTERPGAFLERLVDFLLYPIRACWFYPKSF